MTLVYEDPSIPPLIASPQSFVLDPVYSDVVELELDVVSVAEPTSGPNRYTLHVPSETTVLSNGAASGRWNTDKGITGYTDSHVHFETKTGPQTVVSLGGPATKSSVGGSSEKGGGGEVPRESHGYSMVTLQNAWHDAQKQHYLFSRTADVTMRTTGAQKRAVIQAVQGIVDMNGGEEVNLAGGGIAVGAQNELAFKDVKYTKNCEGETPHSLAAKNGATAALMLAGVTTTAFMVKSAISAGAAVYRRYKDGSIHASVGTFADVVEWAADGAELYRTVKEIAELFGEEEAVENCIRLDAENDFGVSAGADIAFFGINGATLMSPLWTSVSAVVSASLNGTLFAGVAGAYVSLKGKKKVEIGCGHGEVVFDAKKDIRISPKKNFIAVGKELAKVSGEENAYFSGGKKAWIGVAAGGGWGLQLRKDGVMLGKANSAKAMKKAWIAQERSIKVAKDGLTLTSASTVMTIGKNAVEAKAASIKLHAKDADVRVGGKKILIDGP